MQLNRTLLFVPSNGNLKTLKKETSQSDVISPLICDGPNSVTKKDYQKASKKKEKKEKEKDRFESRQK